MILKEHVLNKVTKFNWWHITDIPVTNTAGAPTKDLIMQHGQLSYERLRQWAMAEIVGQQNRAAQDNHMLYSCLTKSISQDVMKSDNLLHKRGFVDSISQTTVFH